MQIGHDTTTRVLARVSPLKPNSIEGRNKDKMTATAFSAVFVFALIVNVIATLRSSSLFRKRFGGDRTCNNDDDEAYCASTRLPDEERRKRSEIIVKHYYLPVYLLAVFSDWVKGPYGYELYSSGDYYNYSPHEIYLLCSVIPFVSSIVFGTFVCGPIADNGIDYYLRRRSGGRRRGRKQMAMIFALVTTISNIAKHFRSFKASVIGSILEGISTSLLFTGFDSWLISSLATTTTSVPTPSLSLSLQLSRTLATAEYANNIVAISAGWIATVLAETTDFRPLLGTTNALENPKSGGDSALLYVGGVLNPFDLSSFALLLCAISIHIFRDEIHGEETEQEKETTPNHQSGGKASSNEATSSPWWQRYRSSLADAFMTTIHSKEIIFTGLICPLFESAMFIFVFTWTNAIVSRIEGQQEIPFGLIFATFMFGCMTGTCVFTVLIDELKIKNENIGKGLLFGATCTFIGMVFAKSTISTMIAFFLFEVSVGVYFPMMGTMKSEIVPEKHRATIYNMYRMPFNIIMLLFLSSSGDPSSYLSLYPESSFAICACMVGTACFLQVKLGNYQERRKLSRPSKKSEIILSDQALQQKKLS